jgi:hypothetical protein
MGKDKSVGPRTRAHNEQSRTQQDCCGAAGSLGEVQGAAEEGSVTLVRSEQKERERDFVPLSGVSFPLGDEEFRVPEPRLR